MAKQKEPALLSQAISGVLPAAEALNRLVLAGLVPSVQLQVAPGYLDQNARVVKFKAMTCVPDTCP